MLALLRFFLAVIALQFKSRRRLEAENAVLRHQLIILRRKVAGWVRLTNGDRWFLVQLYRLFPSILRVLTISVVTHEGKGKSRYHVTMARKTYEELTAGKHTPERLYRGGVSFPP
jgi:hypothetical protein